MRRECGCYYNKGRFVVTCVMFPIIIIFVTSDKMLVAMGIDSEVSKIAKRYVCMMIPGVWATGQFDIAKMIMRLVHLNHIPIWT